jgi:hypothetical protein
MALEALEEYSEQEAYARAADQAITAIKQALAAPTVQEPCGRLESDPDEGHIFVPRVEGDWSMLGKDLFTTQPAAPVQQEPVGIVHHKPASVVGADYEQVAVFTRAVKAGTRLYDGPPAAQPAAPDFKAFKAWANDAGYDTAYTNDGIKWICLNPMTADLWKAWQAAHGIKEKNNV